jgi:anti-sigma factor RsiW
MSCSGSDLKDYFFGELGEEDCARVRAHLETCQACSEELDRLRLTEAALHSLREEEPPRRIAFVSDKVFEPHWWRAWWDSGPRLGFASAALLSVAILVHAFARPVVTRPGPPVDAAVIEARASSEAASRLDAAVRAAVAESEARQARRTAELVAAARKEIEFERSSDRVAFEETMTLLQKRYNGLLIASAELGGHK